MTQPILMQVEHIAVWAVVGCVLFAALAIILPKLLPLSWAWVQETFGSPARTSSAVLNLIPMGPQTARPFSKPAAKGFIIPHVSRPCYGTSEDCEGWSVTTRDTSSGYCPPEYYCGPCAAAYDKWLAKCDGPADAFGAIGGRS